MDFWQPGQQKASLLHTFGLAVVSTPEMRYIADKLDFQPQQQSHAHGGVLTPRVAARLPAWHIRAPWFPFNSLQVKEYASIADRAFRGRRDLVSARIGGAVSEIGAEAFARCTSLSEVRCETGVEKIGKRAFAQNPRLTRCQLADSVQLLEEQVFQGCTALVSLRLPNAVETLPDALCDGCTSLQQVAMPTALRSIGEKAFHASGLQKILLPDSCIRLGAGAFSDCKRLTSVQVSLRLAIISEECFAGCTALAQFDFPFRLAEIRDRAFYGCTSLTNVVIPEGVRRIGEQAFACCDSLKTIRIPSSVRQIGDNAFFSRAKRRLGGSRVQVIANHNSYAWQYCQQNGIRVREP